MANATAARAQASDVMGADWSAITATTPSEVIDAATSPQASPLPLSLGSTPTTVNTEWLGAQGNRHWSSQSRLTSRPWADGTP